MKEKVKRFLVCVFYLVFMTGLVYSQSSTTGAINGRVLDKEGIPIPGVEVRLYSPDLIGGAQTKITNEEGKYRFVAILRGTYVVETSLPGFVIAKKDKIKIFVGETITIDLVIEPAHLQETVTITAAAPTVDIKDSQMNTTNLDRQMLQTVGSEMRWKGSTSLINLAPGVNDGSAMGAPAKVSNQWQIDGQSLLTYVGSGEDWQFPDMDIIEEAQISGSGASAENGNFTGAVLNLVTKSGGNTFEGLLSTSYSPFEWNQKNFDPADPLFSLYEAPPRILFSDFHLGLGGPIIKDKLWFYAAGGWIKEQTEIKGSTAGAILGKGTRQVPKGFAKLTFQLDKNSRLSAFVEYERWQMFNMGLSVNRTVEATQDQKGDAFPLGLNFLHTFSENTFAEIKLGYFYGWWDGIGKQGRDVPERYDYLTGQVTGNATVWDEAVSSQVTASATLTHHAADFIKGSHDFKIGVEFMSGTDDWAQRRNGGYSYTDNYPYSFVYQDYRPTTLAYSYGFDIKSNGWKVSAFAQDSWTIGDRLTINPGVRWSMQRGYLPNIQPGVFFKPQNYIEPRIGLTFDLFGDHKTALKAHYGRFHESFKTWYFNALDHYQDWVWYEVLPDKTKVEQGRVNYSLSGTVDPRIRIPYSDQFTVGLETTIMKDTSLGVTFTHRIYKDFIGRVNTMASWEPYMYSYVDENGNPQEIEVYAKTTPDEDDRFMITNPRAGANSVLVTPNNTYSAISLSLNKSFSAGLMFHIDYTYSRARGNMFNSSTASWGGNYFENPNRQINAYGNLTYDAPHALNIYGTISLPLGFVFTPRFSAQSGSQWTPYIQINEINGIPWVYLEAAGSRRLPAQIALDLRLEKLFTFTPRYKLGLILDAFNIFNRGVATGLNTRVNGPDYGKANSVVEPRYFRMGMRFYF